MIKFHSWALAMLDPLITKVKPHWANIVLGWETAWGTLCATGLYFYAI